jgi:hypothetical protein
MNIYTITVRNIVEDYLDYIVVCAPNGHVAKREALCALIEMGRSFEHWKIMDLEIWD